MTQYKLTSYSTGLTIAEGCFESTAEAWTELSKLSKENIIAVLWSCDKEIPALLSSERFVKAYTEKYGKNLHEMPSVEYFIPFCIGLTGDDFSSKEIG